MRPSDVRTRWVWVGAGLLLFALTALVPRATAQLSPEVEERVASARTALMEMRLDAADSLLTAPGLNLDEQALVAYHRSYIPLIGVLLADGQKNTDQFFERSDFARDLLDDAPDTPWFQWLSGEVELQRSLVWAKRGEYLRAGLAANAAYHRFNTAHSEGDSEGSRPRLCHRRRCRVFAGVKHPLWGRACKEPVRGPHVHRARPAPARPWR